MNKFRKGVILDEELFSVVDSGAIGCGLYADGRLIPVLYLDYKDNPSFEKFLELHEHFNAGDVDSTWAKEQKDKDLLFLELDFKRPSPFTITIKFQLSHQAAIVDHILTAKGAYLQSKKLLGKPVSQTMDESRVIVEIPTPLDVLDWEKTRQNIIARKFRTEGCSRPASKEMAKEFWKRVSLMQKIRPKPPTPL